MRELLRALAERPDDGSRYLLYARARWQEQPLDTRFRWRLIGARDPLWHLRAARAANSECDVFLSSNSYLSTLFLRIPDRHGRLRPDDVRALDAAKQPLDGD